MSLEQRLIDYIKSHGPITVAHFMETALFDPEFGYYTTHNPFGSKGDFITAPEISQIYGEMIGLWAYSVWEQMEKPDKIAIVEIGGGNGTLMSDFLRGVSHIKDFCDALNVHMVDASPLLLDKQRKKLSLYETTFFFHTDISSLPEEPFILIANELFDALPIHQFIYKNGTWLERHVDYSNGSLTFVDLTQSSFTRAVKNKYNIADENAVVELNIKGNALAHTIAKHIESFGGAALFIDYGYVKQPFLNSLQAVKSHSYHNILENIGETDITAHVNFGELIEIAHKYNVGVTNCVTQRSFLNVLGINMRLERLLLSATGPQQKQLASGVARLLDVDNMGSLFKVLAYHQSGFTTPLGFTL